MYLANPRGAALGVTFIVFVLLMIGLFFAVRADATYLLEKEHDSVADILAAYSSSLSSAFNQRLSQVTALAAFASLHSDELNGKPNNEFDIFAGGLYSLSPGVQALAIMPNGVASYVYPVAGNEKLVGMDMLHGQPTDVSEDVQRAIQSKQQVLSEPQVQPSGGLNIASYLAIYKGNTFWGLAAVDLQLTQILQSAGILPNENELVLAIRTQMGSPIMGDVRVFDASPEEIQISLPEGSWTIAATPTNGWDAAIYDQLLVFRLIMLLVVLVALPATYYFAQRRFALSSAFHQQAQTLAQTAAGKQEIESSLRSREERYFHLFNTMQDPVFVYLVEEDGTPGSFMEVNDVACRLLGYTHDELMVKSRSDVTPLEFRPALLDAIRKISPQGTTQIESELMAKDGKRIMVESKGQAYISDGKTYLIAIARDITERKKAEIELKNLNRALRMISECNQALVRATDEMDLLSNICRIVTDAGGYRMAWVGYAEQDEAQTVRPVASSGFEEGYLESAHISWADVPRGQGPTGRAIRTKEPIICSDFQSDPNFLPWREEATRRGYRSSIALPLTSNEQCFGALTIYSAEANRFGEVEEKLLIELANDLAYGVTALRTRAEHEKALDEIESMARFPAENPSPVLRIDSTGKMLYCNDAGQLLCNLMKISKAGIVSPAWRKLIKNVLDSGQAEMIEMKLGEQAMEVWLMPVQGRGYVNLYGHDITERKQAEEALRESEDKFKYVFDYSVIGKSITLIDGEMHANKAFCDMLGYSVEELQKKKWEEITYPDDIEMNQKALDLVMSGEQETARLTKRYIKKDGSIMWGDLSTALRRDNEGKPLYYFTSLIDITERKNAEDQILELNESLEQRVKERTAQLEAVNRELETFSYSVAHDLKAPLRGIDGYSHLLQEDYANKLDENGQAFLKNIRSATENMNQLIEDLLAYSRMERRSFASAEIDIRSMVDSLLEARSVEITSKSIQMKVDLPFEEVNADIDGLSAVLRNLLDNAIKFTSKVKHPKIEVGGKELADTKLLWVRDNGIGFEMQYAERIFEIFQRLQRAEDYPGTGVGLAIVRKAMQRMGGRVWAESEPGKGTTFYLEFRRTV
jgi:PAS domain S-box-containing protein